MMVESRGRGRLKLYSGKIIFCICQQHHPTSSCLLHLVGFRSQHLCDLKLSFQLLFWLLFDICANYVSKITDTILFSNIKIIHHTAQVCHIFIWLFSHHKIFQATVQQAPSTKSCVPYGLKKGHQTDNQCLAGNTFHSGSQVTGHTVNNCELLSSVQLLT